MSKRDLALITAAMLASVALSGSLALAQEDEATPDGDEATSAPLMEVDVVLQEWAVLPELQTLPAGTLTFNAQNIGPMDPHELVIVRTDIPASELPTREDGAFDEAAEGVLVIGEIEEFPVGETRSMTFDLEPGHYVFLCNLVEEEDGEIEAHYKMGMWVDVEVTG